MDIKVKTLYDRKTLLDFNSYYVMKKAVLMWVIAISNVLIIAEWITLLALSADIGKVMYVISALILAIVPLSLALAVSPESLICSRLLASSRSEIASASVRVSLPLIKARRVNSPAVAGTAP